MTINLQDSPGNCISDYDLAVLAEWAAKQSSMSVHPSFKKPFALIREGADTLLRCRARATDYQNSEKKP